MLCGMTSFPFNLPEVDFSKFDPRNFELPDVDLPDTEQITGFLRDAAYVGVGLAAMTVERVHALQQQLFEHLTSQLAASRD